MKISDIITWSRPKHKQTSSNEMKKEKQQSRNSKHKLNNGADRIHYFDYAFIWL